MTKGSHYKTHLPGPLGGSSSRTYDLLSFLLTMSTCARWRTDGDDVEPTTGRRGGAHLPPNRQLRLHFVTTRSTDFRKSKTKRVAHKINLRQKFASSVNPYGLYSNWLDSPNTLLYLSARLSVLIKTFHLYIHMSASCYIRHPSPSPVNISVAPPKDI